MDKTPKAARLPEGMSIREIGAHMAGLRQGFGLSQQEVSERMHIRPRYIAAIEEGKFELMPGKVYARGYVHTYAEFLGLDADQVVQLCFAGEPPANQQKHAPAPVMRAPITIDPRAWRGYGIMAVVALVVIILISQLTGRGDESEVAESAVAPVPKDMMKSVRNLVMPTPSNHECLMRDSVLGCFYADDVTRALSRQNTVKDIDVSGMAIEPAEEGEPVPEEVPND